MITLSVFQTPVMYGVQYTHDSSNRTWDRFVQVPLTLDAGRGSGQPTKR